MVSRKACVNCKVCLLFLLVAVIVTLWAFIPGPEGFNNSGPPVSLMADLNEDSIMEQYLLEKGHLTVSEGEQHLWQTPGEWHVDCFALEDVDNDGVPNLTLSLWKQGSFGSQKPFWHDGKDISYKNHLFVFKMVDNTFKEVWCSSNLDRPIVSFSIQDMDGDGLNELVVQEGEYRKVYGERYTLDTDSPIRTTVLQWQEWGFSTLTDD